MKIGNLLTIIRYNFFLSYKRTLFPAAVLLLVIPLIYGTSNLDSMKSADCLERMVALIGLPMFVSLLKPEQSGSMGAVIALRSFPYRIIVFVRLGISLFCTLVLILLFERYMRICGCAFPAVGYAFRTLVVSLMLGFTGLLASAASGNTALGFMVSFCGCFALQTEMFGRLLRAVSYGVGAGQILFLAASTLGIIVCVKLSMKDF